MNLETEIYFVTGVFAVYFRNSLYRDMVDQSNYSTDECTLISTWVHETLGRQSTYSEVTFRQESTVILPKMTILRWERKLLSTNSVKDRQRPGWPPKHHEKYANVTASLLRSPKKLLWKQSSEFGIPEASMLSTHTYNLGHYTSH